MHKLKRPACPPSCLSQYKHERDNWGDVTEAHKGEIWLKLDAMQHKCCAYCECAIKTDIENSNSHIEHFRQRRRTCYPEGTFAWENIFGSCNKQDSCGNHKDSLPPYKYQDLIKMDVEDPEDFIAFSPDGSVSPKSGLSVQDQHRAKETIRIFNLDGSLRKIRESYIQGYKQTAEYFAELANEYTEDEWLPLLQEELSKVQHLPFATAIKHILLPS